MACTATSSRWPTHEECPCFSDTYGPALDGIRGFWPTAIQLNRREAAIRLRKTRVTDDDVAGLLCDWSRRGVVCGVVTDGPNAVSIVYRGQQYRAIPPEIKVVNPIGSGDSLLAGMVDGWLSGLDPSRCSVMPSGVRSPTPWFGTPVRSSRVKCRDGANGLSSSPSRLGTVDK